MKSIFCMLIVLMSWHMSVFSAAPDAGCKTTTEEPDIVSIKKLVRKFGAAHRKKDSAAALSSCAQLSLLVFMDWKYLDEDQIEDWAVKSGRYANRLKELGVSDPSTALNKEKKKLVGSLIKKIENDKCRIDWSELLGGLDEEPAPKELKAHRIAELKSFGAVLPMS